MFLYNLKKIIVSPATYAAAGLLFLAMILSREVQGCPALPAYLFDAVFHMDYAGDFMPIAAVLPIAYLRHSLHRGAAWQLSLLRCTPLRYTLGGLAAAFVSGVLVLLLSAAAFHLYVVLCLPGPVSYEYTLFGDMPFYMQMPVRAAYLVRIGVTAVTAGMYALVAYGVSAVTANQYVCAASGFAFMITLRDFGAMIALGLPEKYWPVFTAIDPGTCNSFSSVSMGKDGGMIHLACYVFAIALLSGGLFWLRLKRRLKNG